MILTMMSLTSCILVAITGAPAELHGPVYHFLVQDMV